MEVDRFIKYRVIIIYDHYNQKLIIYELFGGVLFWFVSRAKH